MTVKDLVEQLRALGAEDDYGVVVSDDFSEMSEVHMVRGRVRVLHTHRLAVIEAALAEGTILK